MDTFLQLSCAALVMALVAMVSAQPSICIDKTQQFAYDFYDCNKFYYCSNKEAYHMRCPNNLVFSMTEARCVFLDSEHGSDCEVAVMDAVEDGLVDFDGLKTDTFPDNKKVEEVEEEEEQMVEEKEEEQIEEEEEEEEIEEEEEQMVEEEVEGLDGDDAEQQGLALDTHCIGMGAKVVKDEKYCHRYYNCSKPHMDDMNRYLTPYEYECEYPKLFSEETQQCEHYSMVECGDRMAYKDPCDYASNMCSGPNCRPCYAVHPSCVDQPNGVMYWPGREGSGFWVNCQDGRVIDKGNCGEGFEGGMQVFSEASGGCMPFGAVVEEMCSFGAGRRPHETECHRYYDCAPSVLGIKGIGLPGVSNPNSFVKTCPYPMLFSLITGACEDYDRVDCNGRIEPKRPCEYMEAMCDDPNYSSCVGLKDGDNVFHGREGSPSYVSCKDERTMQHKMCEEDEYGVYKQFAPGPRACVSIIRPMP